MDYPSVEPTIDGRPIIVYSPCRLWDWKWTKYNMSDANLEKTSDIPVLEWSRARRCQWSRVSWQVIIKYIFTLRQQDPRLVKDQRPGFGGLRKRRVKGLIDLVHSPIQFGPNLDQLVPHMSTDWTQGQQS